METGASGGSLFRKGHPGQPLRQQGEWRELPLPQHSYGAIAKRTLCCISVNLILAYLTGARRFNREKVVIPAFIELLALNDQTFFTEGATIPFSSGRIGVAIRQRILPANFVFDRGEEELTAGLQRSRNFTDHEPLVFKRQQKHKAHADYAIERLPKKVGVFHGRALGRGGRELLSELCY